MSVLIGLLGMKQSGKDTAGRRLVEEHGYVRFAFADVMKDCLLALNPWVTEDYRLETLISNYGWDIVKENYPEVRRLVQVFGTEVGREILGGDLWVDALRPKVLAALGEGRNVVLTDVRFDNEADLVSELDGDLIRVERKGLPDEDRHVSEVGWRSIQPDWVIHNNGTIEDLHEEVDYIAHDRLTLARYDADELIIF